MHTDYPSRYMPTSPLSPRTSTDQGRLSPTSTRTSIGQSKAAPKRLHMHLPAYSLNYGDRSASASPNSRLQSPALTLNRVSQPIPMDPQRSMGKGQRELIRQLKLSSQLAASPMAHRPDAPRLDPLGSPKGAVTPLALEQQEAGDYFGLGVTGRYSPGSSPGGRSSRSDASDKEKKKKKQKTELYI